MKIIETSILTNIQTEEIATLTDACRSHDKIRLTYPADESGDGCRHYLLYEENGTLAAVLAMLPLDDRTAECSAFTHPAYRRQGCFSRLLDIAAEQFETCDILFGVPESCHAAIQVLSALGAEQESLEHQMELLFPVHSFDTATDTGAHLSCHGGLTLASSPDKAADTVEWTLNKDGLPIGRCLITTVSEGCVCLHHLEIAEPLRQKGYGSSFLSLLLPRIAEGGFHKIILQVSGDNPAAVALYKKTGFRITETLSYYCY